MIRSNESIKKMIETKKKNLELKKLNKSNSNEHII